MSWIRETEQHNQGHWRGRNVLHYLKTVQKLYLVFNTDERKREQEVPQGQQNTVDTVDSNILYIFCLNMTPWKASKIIDWATIAMLVTD